MTDGHHHSGGFAPGARSWKHLPRIFPYLRRYRGLAVLSSLMLFIGVAISLLEPWPMAFLVDGVLGSRSRDGVVTDLFGTDARKLVIVAAICGFLLALLSNGLHVLNEYVNTKLDTRLRLDFRRDLFAKAQQLSLSYHDTHRAGYFAQNINTHTTALGAIVTDIPPLVQSVLTLIGMFVIAFLMDPLLAVLALGVVPFIYYSTVFYSKHIEPRLIKTRDEEGLSLSVVHEAMAMLRVILAFRREDHELGRFTRQAKHAIGLRLDVTVRQTVFSLAVNVITAAGTALVLGVGALHVLDKRLTVGELLVMMGYIASVYRPLQTISYTMGAWQEHLVDFWLALELLDQEPDIVERADALALERVEGQVTFEGVSFSYKNRVDTLSNIAFDVPAGSVVAIVGPTGAGKSTLTNLIPRFYEPAAGRVLLDGHDVRDLTLDSLRLNLAVVQQEPMLFLATIGENIRYGCLDAPMEDVVEAAKQANAHDFIMALPDQYDTRLGERGSMLSGGERQRICIARAFLKDAPVLILDEPTSSIDSRTESVILDALDRLMVGRTTFIVAHRLSTIGRADTILVLDGGRLIEQGSHEELLAIEGGLYRQLWTAQTAGRRTADPSAAAPLPPAPAPVPAAPTPAPAPVVPSVKALLPAPAVGGRPKAVVLGMMTKMPVAGVVWQTVHYLIGLERLGYDAYYVEAHARTPSMLMTHDDDDSTVLAAAFIERVMGRFGLENRWAFQA
ncbi:MAG TPA: ABC transporter ATP-binding protein, partial [Acidimicrobiales bacterium]